MIIPFLMKFVGRRWAVVYLSGSEESVQISIRKDSLPCRFRKVWRLFAMTEKSAGICTMTNGEEPRLSK